MKSLALLLALFAIGTLALVQPAEARGGTNKIVSLRADLKGPDLMGGQVTFEQGKHTKMKAEVWGFYAGQATLLVAGSSYTISVDEFGYGFLFMDSRRGDRVPQISERDVAAVSSGSTVLMEAPFHRF